MSEAISEGGRPDPATEAFVAHRNLLFTVAYEMLGSAADAEDVLQETWLRWVNVDLDTVLNQRAYLVTITTRPAQGVVRRPLAARAASHRSRRGRRCRAG
jgi:RNA polymerase sigma-70 factor (ECF subfamily)